MAVEIFTVSAKGVGRKDYSAGTELSVEPLISSWQSVYLFYKQVSVPAGGSLVTVVGVPLNQVVLLYDFFASIPANRLIELMVEAIDLLGIIATVVDEIAYQTVAKHVSKGFPFFKTIRFTTYNYGDVPENFRIGCVGLYTSAEQYHIVPGPP